MTTNENESELSPFLLAKEGDIVLVRAGTQFVVRSIKRYQEFVPRPLFDELDFGAIVWSILYGLWRKVPPMFTSRYQAGIIAIPSSGSGRPKVVGKRKFATREQSDQYQALMHEQLLQGLFDDPVSWAKS